MITVNHGLFGLEPPPCRNSFVFEVIRPEFCPRLGCVKIYHQNNNESYCFNNDVTMTSSLKCALRYSNFFNFFIFHPMKLKIGTKVNQDVLRLLFVLATEHTLLRIFLNIWPQIWFPRDLYDDAPQNSCTIECGTLNCPRVLHLTARLYNYQCTFT